MLMKLTPSITLYHLFFIASFHCTYLNDIIYERSLTYICRCGRRQNLVDEDHCEADRDKEAEKAGHVVLEQKQKVSMSVNINVNYFWLYE